MKLRPTNSPGLIKQTAYQLNVLWSPMPKQARALACPVDDILFGGAVGGGKTDYMLAAWVQHAQMYGNAASGLIVRKTMPELRDIMKRAQRLFTQLGAKWRGQPHNTWTFRNGAVLLLGSLESVDSATKFWGQEYTFFGVDEAGHYKTPEAIDLIRSRLRGAPHVRKQIVMTANPGGSGHRWLVERYIKPAKPYTPFLARDEEGQELDFYRVYIPSRLTDNKYLMADKAYVGRILSSGPRWLVRALLLGDWNIQLDAGVLKREWWQEYSMLPAGNPIHCIQSWDTSFGKNTHKAGDRSVCITFLVFPNAYYIVDVWAGRLPFPDLKKKAIDLATKWQCYEVLIEDAASGQSLIQELQRETRLAIRPVTPDGDKTTRAFAVSPLIESKRVYIPCAGYSAVHTRFPVTSDWRNDFLDECSGFPQAAHDDIVDALSQGLRNLATRFVVGNAGDHSYTLEDFYKEEEDEDA